MHNRSILFTRPTTSALVMFVVALFCAALLSIGSASSAWAEGSKNLNSDDTGYRAYTERYGMKTVNESRQTNIYVYAKAGETLYFGGSVKAAKLGYTAADLGVDQATLDKVNSTDIAVVFPEIDGGMPSSNTSPYNSGVINPYVKLFDVDNNATQGSNAQGYLSTRAMELAGPSQVAAGGYNGFSFTAEKTGVYLFKFYSRALSSNNPVMLKANDDKAFTEASQHGGVVAGWDVTVKKANGSIASGRVFTDELFVNMGSNKSGQDVLKAKMYPVTSDGYKYEIDFNGMDPYGFVFFANNRGLLTGNDTDGWRSLYHSVRSQNNQLSDLNAHGIKLNNTPTEDGVDETYHLFFQEPDNDALMALNIPTDVEAIAANAVTNEAFTSSRADGHCYPGDGGTFSFDVDAQTVNASSYEITLDFGNGNTRVLSNALNQNGTTNSVKWDGKDGKGNVVPAGNYTSSAKLTLKGGEIHFPLMDVEDNRNGIIVKRLNGNGATAAAPDTTVHFNSSANSIGDTTAPWSVSNWVVGSKQDYSVKDYDSAGNPGAMKYTGRAGDQTALDLWANYSEPTNAEFGLVIESLTSCTVSKTWKDVPEGTATPTSVTVQLYKDGNAVSDTELSDGQTAQQTLNAANEWTYTWNNLPTGGTYTARETTVPDCYLATYKNTGNAGTGYTTKITNTYIPIPEVTSKIITVTKVWEGDPTAHPAEVTGVLRDVSAPAGQTKDNDRDFTLNATNNWTQTWNDSTILDDHFYMIVENDIEGYEQTGYDIDDSETDPATGKTIVAFKLTNAPIPVPEPETTMFTITKAWVGGTPGTIQMQLYKDGAPVAAADGGIITLDGTVDAHETSPWVGTWNNLDADHIYTADEVACPENFTEKASEPMYSEENGWTRTITNTYVPPTTSVSVTKNWDLGDYNTDTITVPDSVTLTLSNADGSIQKSATVDRAGRWTHTWADLPEGQTWTVSETPMNNYTSSVTQDVSSSDENGWVFSVTNTFIPPTPKSKIITVTKVWKGNSEQNPAQVTGVLRDVFAPAGQTKDADRPFTLNAANNWTQTWNNNTILDDHLYTIVEDEIAGYEQTGLDVDDTKTDPLTGKTIMAFTLTNTYIQPIQPIQPTTSVSVTKEWDLGSHSADTITIPDSVTLTLSNKDGSIKQSATIGSADNWKHTWTNLPQGQTWTVSETTIDHFTPTVTQSETSSDANGWAFTVKNTYNAAKPPVPVSPNETKETATPTKAAASAAAASASTGDHGFAATVFLACILAVAAVASLQGYRRRQR